MGGTHPSHLEQKAREWAATWRQINSYFNFLKLFITHILPIYQIYWNISVAFSIKNIGKWEKQAVLGNEQTPLQGNRKLAYALELSYSYCLSSIQPISLLYRQPQWTLNKQGRERERESSSKSWPTNSTNLYCYIFTICYYFIFFSLINQEIMPKWLNYLTRSGIIARPH